MLLCRLSYVPVLRIAYVDIFLFWAKETMQANVASRRLTRA